MAIVYQTESTASNVTALRCPECGCLVGVQVTVYRESPPRPRPKAKNPAPRFEPPEPPAYPPIRLNAIVPQNRPRPLLVRRQPRVNKRGRNSGRWRRGFRGERRPD
jgi:hypothetical protein